MNEFSKRLQQALDLRHINAIDLAKKTKIGKSSFYYKVYYTFTTKLSKVTLKSV